MPENTITICANLIRVALDVPLEKVFDYLADDATPSDIGRRVVVPFGTRKRLGIIVDLPASTDQPLTQLKTADTILRDEPALSADFMALCEFASRYYQASFGEVLLQSLPPGLKKTIPVNRRKIADKRSATQSPPLPTLNTAQQAVVDAVQAHTGFQTFLLFGVTGSGKTEVYLRLMAWALTQHKQVLLLVPEINLTPQLEGHVRSRFPAENIAVLHSELTEAARERAWRAAVSGEASLVVGTRLAVFTPLPALGLILVDEEHDASYKQQDGMRYSARDLAIYRASQAHIPVVLGSATPSLESWLNAQTGRFHALHMPDRANPLAKLPIINIVDTRKETLQEGLSDALLKGIALRLDRGEQSLVFINRRGYAPVLTCTACGWVSGCKRCAAHLVVHLADHRLRCHHCGFETRLPASCPGCGNQDIQAFGRGTQKIENWLAEYFPSAKILRVDRDSARSRKQWEAMLNRIHSHDPEMAPDILVGTQMLAKGHDFPRLTFVGIIGADAALFAADCRAPERLFAQLMQVSGRAGRANLPGEVLVQTQHPDHPVFSALVHHDYPGFAASLLKEREQAGFPPYSFQAILRAEAPNMSESLAFLNAARELPSVLSARDVCVYDPVPMRMARLANLERGQLLLESTARRALQNLLPMWRAEISGLKTPRKLRWHLEVDPLEF